MTTDLHQTVELSPDDHRIVDLVSTALVDPNLHTDTRMRLHEEITQILRRAHEDTYGASGHDTHEQRLADHDHHLPKVLESVLVDPNLNTDRRMRLHQEISELLRDPH
jgi:hypothetical protein